MTKIILTLTMILMSTHSFAADTSVPRKIKDLPILCQLESDFSIQLFEIYSMDVLEMNSIDPSLLEKINRHLQSNEYIDKTKTFKTLDEVKKFMNDEYSSDELHAVFIKHRLTGKEYVYVKSYPGDNEYGLYFDAETSEVVATNGDGEIVLETNHGPISCYQLNH